MVAVSVAKSGNADLSGSSMGDSGVVSDVISFTGPMPIAGIGGKHVISSIDYSGAIASGSITVGAPVSIGSMFDSAGTQHGGTIKFGAHNIALTLTGSGLDGVHVGDYTCLKSVDFCGKDSKLIISSKTIGNIEIKATIDGGAADNHSTIEVQSSVEFSGTIGQGNPIFGLHIQEHASSTITNNANFSTEIVLQHDATLVLASGAVVGSSEHPVERVVLGSNAVLNVDNGELYTKELVTVPGVTITNPEHVHVVGDHHDVA